MASSDPRRVSADGLLDEGLRRGASGDLEGALDCYAESRRLYEDLEDYERVAACDQRAAMAYSERRKGDDLDRALELSGRALDYYEQVGDDVAAAKIRVNISAALLRAGRHQDALDYAHDALPSFLGPERVVEAATCRQNIGIALGGLKRLKEAAEQLRLASSLLESATLGAGASFTPPPEVRRAEIELSLGAVLSRLDRLEDALKAFDNAGALFTAYGLKMRVASVWSSRAAALGRAGQFEQALHAAREAATRFDELDQSMRAGASRVMEARALLRLDRAEEALPVAVGALTELEQGRYSLRRAAIRAGWFIQYLGAYDVACESALRCGHPALVAVLVELARTQSLPSLAPVPGDVDRLPAEPLTASPPPVLRGRERARSAALAAAGEVPLGAPGAPVVAGETLRLPGSAGALDIAALARQVGGPQAWWWGSLATQDRLWWFVLPPDEEVQAGSTVMNEEFLRAFDELQESIPTDRMEASPARLAQGPFNAPVGRSDTLWGRLGRLLLPPPLVRALRGSSRLRPMSLVVAPSAVMANVPIPVLTVPGTQDVLVDRAVVRVAPSTALLAEIGSAPAPIRAPRRAPVVIAVLGPTDDLKHARKLGVTARQRLVGTQATFSAVTSALSALKQEEHGVALFTCHIEQQLEDVPSTASLILADQPLSARDILARDSRLRSPTRVVLAGCISVGQLGGEWLSLGPAFVYAGAHHVLLTVWPLVDDREALRFDGRLTKVARRRADPASSVRCLQRRAIRRRWRPGRDLPPLFRWGGIVTLTSRL